MSDNLYYLIQDGEALAAAKAYVEDCHRVQQENIAIAKELGVEMGVHDRETKALRAVEFKDRASTPVGFTLANKQTKLSYPKAGAEWDRRFRALGLRRTAGQIIFDLFETPTSITYTRGDDEYGNRMLSDSVLVTGFLYLSPEGPFALYTPNIKAEVKAYEDDGYTVDAASKEYKDDLPGCVKINKEDWDLLVAKFKAQQATVTAEVGQRINPALSFQENVSPWMVACFPEEIVQNLQERNNRFLEEALELVQSGNYTAEQAHAMVDYVFGRPVGEMKQEVGGVMVTLAALCQANKIDMHDCGNAELARVWTKIDKIRSKQDQKPKHLALGYASPSLTL